MNEFLRILYRLDQQGSARKIPDSVIDQEEQSLIDGNLCRSNDHHIIAIARISTARLLCTDDGLLMQDFKDPVLISNPRGKIYRRESHADLIRTKCAQLNSKRDKKRRRRR
jgi:hypothetical protein